MWIRPFVIGVAGAAVTLALVLPKEVRAIAAALVNVTNTAANPVPTRGVELLDAFQTRLYPRPTVASFVVPAGKYLVINSITGFAFTSVTSSALLIDTTAAGQIGETRLPFVQPNTGARQLQVQPVQLVADPGSTVYVSVDTTSSDYGGYNVDIKGYYVPAP